MMRKMAVQVSGENGGVLVDELANWRRKGIKSGEGGRGRGGCWKRRGTAKGSVGRFVENMAASHINKEVMGSKKFSTKDRVGNLGKDERKSKFERRKREVNPLVPSGRLIDHKMFFQNACTYPCKTG